MAEDIDGNYYHAASPLNYVFDNIAVVEDADGYASIEVGGSQVRVHPDAVAYPAQRGAPSTSELDAGEHMMYVADGSAANSTAGDVVIARNNSGTIEEAVISLTYSGV